MNLTNEDYHRGLSHSIDNEINHQNVNHQSTQVPQNSKPKIVVNIIKQKRKSVPDQTSLSPKIHFSKRFSSARPIQIQAPQNQTFMRSNQIEDQKIFERIRHRKSTIKHAVQITNDSSTNQASTKTFKYKNWFIKKVYLMSFGIHIFKISQLLLYIFLSARAYKYKSSVSICIVNIFDIIFTLLEMLTLLWIQFFLIERAKRFLTKNNSQIEKKKIKINLNQIVSIENRLTGVTEENSNVGNVGQLQ